MSKILILLALIFSYCAYAADDPTKPFGVVSSSYGEVTKVKTMTLDSIIHGAGVHTAIINGKLVKVGDYIGEFKLVAVNDKSVLLRSEEESKKLFIFSELVAK